jgi:hypothetical protein
MMKFFSFHIIERLNVIPYPDAIYVPDIPDEWRWERIRLWRDKLLAASDFRMIEDAPWDKTAWANYRQALRDLPSTVTNPADIVFPQPPSGGN